MKKILVVLLFAAALLFAAPLVAGEGKGCSHETQACLDYMVEHYADKGYIGIELDSHGADATIEHVYPDTPAAESGLKAGDALVAINGVKMGDEKMEAVWSEAVPGKTFNFTVARAGKEKNIDIELGTMPDDMMARMIGQHMLEHATIEVAQGN